MAGLDDVLLALSRLRSEVIVRLDRVQDSVNGYRDDVIVTMGAASQGERAAKNVREKAETTRESMLAIFRKTRAMVAQIEDLQNQVDGLRRGTLG